MKKPVQFGAKPRRASDTISTLAKDGLDIRDLPQLLDTSKAQVIKNWLIDAQGQLIKRKGLKLKDTLTLTTPSMLQHYYNNVFIVGYDTTISAVDLSTGVETIIDNSSFSAGAFDGVAYGNYFFTCNGTTKIQRISLTLTYGTQTANFASGLVLTGATSGATATILEDVDAGVTGTLTIGNITGVFATGEVITDSATGSATTTSVLTYANTEISAAPKCKVLHTFVSPSTTDAGARLFAGNIVDSSTSSKSTVIFCNVDTGSNPPFSTWTQDANANTGGKYDFSQAGQVNTISSIGTQVIIGYEQGRSGFRITTIDSSGTIVKKTDPDFQNIEEGMERGAVKTSKGMFYANKSGLYNMFSGGTTNAFDEQVKQISLLLGDDYFNDFTFTNLDIIHDTKRHLVLFTMADDSDTNNTVLAYNTDTGSIVELTMNIQRWAKKGDTIYGISSINGKIYEVFSGFSDDNFAIPTEYQQELQIGSLDGLSDLENFVIQSVLGEDITMDIDINVYDYEGLRVDSIQTWRITGVAPLTPLLSWGSASYGSASWGSGAGGASTLTKPYQAQITVPEIWRLSIKITSNDKTPQAVNFFIARIRDRSEKLNLNNISRIT